MKYVKKLPVKPKTAPSHIHPTSLEKEMKRVLRLTSLPADVRAKLYQDKLSRLLNTKEKLKQEIRPTPQNMYSDLSSLLRGIPPTKQEAALEFLEFLNKYKDKISFNTEKQLIVDGRPIEGSNIVDIFHYAVRDLSREPKGWSNFYSLIQKHGSPRVYNKHLNQRGLGWLSLYG